MSSTTSIRRFTTTVGTGTGTGRSVLCFPHAGGCASFFRPWQPLLPAVRVHAVQYPGREDRFAEPAAAGLSALACTVAREILDSGERYTVLFGHSMGAYVAFETAWCLQQAGATVPAVIVSSAAAPALRPPVPFEDSADVLAYLERYEPVSTEIRQDEELLELVLDYVKDDLRLVAGYREHTGKRIDSRVTAVVGEDDIPEIRARSAQWRGHAGGGFARTVQPGGHFYLRDRPPTELVTAELDRCATWAGTPSGRSS